MSSGSEIEVGDAVRAYMKDGRVFEGTLLDFQVHGGVLCVFLSPGIGLVAEDITTMHPA